MKTCNKCLLEKDDSFYGTVRKAGKEYLSNTCTGCWYKHKSSKDPVKFKEAKRKSNKAYKEKFPIRTRLQGIKNSDKRKGFKDNDLDEMFLEQALSNPCFYCGILASKEVLMTLDRIDNEQSRKKSNLNTCCYRCNLLRGAMPYEAWIFLVPKIKEAQELGLFGDWRSKYIKDK